MEKMAKIAGFTLIELMVTIMIGCIVLAFGIPNFRSFILNQQVQTSCSNFVRAINLARQEAINEGTQVGVCSFNGIKCTNNSWKQGWLVFVDKNKSGDYEAQTDTVVASQTALDSIVEADGTAKMILFDGSGYLVTGSGNYSFHSQNCASNSLEQISLSNIGRPAVSQMVCH